MRKIFNKVIVTDNSIVIKISILDDDNIDLTGCALIPKLK